MKKAFKDFLETSALKNWKKLVSMDQKKEILEEMRMKLCKFSLYPKLYQRLKFEAPKQYKF